MDGQFELFDMSKARGADDRPDVVGHPAGKSAGERSGEPAGERSGEPASDSGPLSVSALVARIKLALADAFPRRVSVVGQLSNVKLHGSGHIYFRLKDADASIDAAMFKSFAGKLKFTPADGLEVVVNGRVDVYDVRGQLQLYAERMTPIGAGALELAFRQLKDKLQAEGLFDPAGKKPIARFPRAIGVVTSASGAAIRDISRTIARRWPAGRILLLSVPVQGAAAAERIARAITLLDANASRLGIDTLIVSRGGGSMEDLWPFNEEPVARAIFAASTPVISGVGHEVDVTIADLVADVRAATPTAAAELAVPDAAEIRVAVGQLAARLRRAADQAIERGRGELKSVMRSVALRDPAAAVRTQIQRADELAYRLQAAVRDVLTAGRRRLADPAGPAGRLAAMNPARAAQRARGRLAELGNRMAWALAARSRQAGNDLDRMAGRLAVAHPRHRLMLAGQRVVALARQLEAMSHHSVIRRGFSVTRTADGGILRSLSQVRPELEIETELADGKFTSVVDTSPDRPEPEEPERRDGPERNDHGQDRQD